jgi:hypothetical protein
MKSPGLRWHTRRGGVTLVAWPMLQTTRSEKHSKNSKDGTPTGSGEEKVAKGCCRKTQAYRSQREWGEIASRGQTRGKVSGTRHALFDMTYLREMRWQLRFQAMTTKQYIIDIIISYKYFILIL